MFNLYDFQEQTLREITEYNKSIILKSRQLGISTLIAAYALWMMIFNPDTNVVVIATKHKVAKNIIKKVRIMYEGLPQWLKPDTAGDFNKTSISFKNGSSIAAEAATDDAGRSEAASILIIDEAAFIDNIDEIWKGAFSTISTGGRVVLLSTPNGIGNFFHKKWVDAEKECTRNRSIVKDKNVKDGRQYVTYNGMGINGFHPIKLHWSVHPDRDDKWRKEQTQALGIDGANQECVSGDTLITVRDKLSGKIRKMTIEDVYDISVDTVLNDYEVLTPSGFQSFDGISATKKDKYIHFIFDDNSELKTSFDHPFVIDGNEVLAQTLHKGDYTESDTGTHKTIIEKNIINEDILLYDLVNVSNGNIYYANNTLIHNCECSFLNSGRNVVHGTIIDWYEKNAQRDPIEKRYGDAFWIFEYAELNTDYLICADVARGDGSDYSSFHVIKVDTLEQVAEYNEQIDTTEYAKRLVRIAKEYNDAVLVVENANIGWAVLQKIIELDYDNLFYGSKDLKIAEMLKNIKDQNYFHVAEKNLVPGFTMSSATRPLAVDKVDERFRNKEVIVHSSRTISQLYTWVWTAKGRADHLPGYNDDLITSLGQGLWVIDTHLRITKQNEQFNKDNIGRMVDYFQTVKKINSYKTTHTPHYQQWHTLVGNEEVDMRRLL